MTTSRIKCFVHIQLFTLINFIFIQYQIYVCSSITSVFLHSSTNYYLTANIFWGKKSNVPVLIYCSSLQLEVKVISTQWMLCYLPWYKKRKKWFVISLFLVVFGIWDAAAVLNLTRTQKCDNDTEEWQLEWMVHWAC